MLFPSRLNWWDNLSAGLRQQLMQQTGLRRPDDIAIRAMENLGFKDCFDQFNAKVFLTPESLGRTAAKFYKLTDFPVVSLLGLPCAVRGLRRRGDTRRPSAGARCGRRRGLPHQAPRAPT
jgi:hypothetical protein